MFPGEAKPGQIVKLQAEGGGFIQYERRGCGSTPGLCRLFLDEKCLMDQPESSHLPYGMTEVIKLDGTVGRTYLQGTVWCGYDEPPIQKKS